LEEESDVSKKIELVLEQLALAKKLEKYADEIEGDRAELFSPKKSRVPEEVQLEDFTGKRKGPSSLWKLFFGEEEEK